MKSRLVAVPVLALLVGVGCAGATGSDSAGTASADSTAALPEPTALVHTDAGGALSVELVVHPPTGAGFASPGLVIGYEDTASFFGHSLDINADVVVHVDDGPDVKGSIAVTDGTGTTAGKKVVSYLGVFIVGNHDVLSIDIALSNNGKRDPSGSKTYHVDFDHADHGCAIVLRDVKAPDFGPVPAGSFVWTGTVDVATKLLVDDGEGDGPAVPGVQWHSEFSSGQNASSEVVTKKVAGASAGYQRFEFSLNHDTIPGSGGTSTQLTSFQMSVLPFVTLPSGVRLFDHNRVANDLQSYVLWSGDTAGGLVPTPNDPNLGKGFGVKNDPNVCKRPL
jgi:hypothetical protein